MLWNSGTNRKYVDCADHCYFENTVPLKKEEAFELYATDNSLTTKRLNMNLLLQLGV